MSSLPPIVSTLAATDVVPVKPATTIGAPNPVIAVEKALNDARLMSRAGAELELANSLLRREPGTTNKGQPFTSSSTALSAAARAISAILGTPHNDIKTLAIKGQHPLLSLTAGARMQTEATTTLSSTSASPLTAAFAAALMRTVASSGLFYESHLLQYTFGRRNLVQMLLEPQARLGPLAQRFPELFSEGPENETPEWLSAKSAVMAQLLKTMPQRISENIDATNSEDITLPEELSGDVTAESDQLLQHSSKHAPDLAQQVVANKLLSAYSVASNSTSRVAQMQQEGDSSQYKTEVVAEDFSKSTHYFQQKNSAEMPTVVSDLMRHQLEILTTPSFRWQGEAWPGVPTDWELERQANDQQSQQKNATDNDNDNWSSCIKMTLPSLGVVELRISLHGNDLQTYVYAQQESSVAALRSELHDLRQRFIANDLQLNTLELAALPVEH